MKKLDCSKVSSILEALYIEYIEVRVQTYSFTQQIVMIQEWFYMPEI